MFILRFPIKQCYEEREFMTFFASEKREDLEFICEMYNLPTDKITEFEPEFETTE